MLRFMVPILAAVFCIAQSTLSLEHPLFTSIVTKNCRNFLHFSAGELIVEGNNDLSICPEISCTSSNRWPDGVVPFTMKLGAFYVNFIEFIISHVYAFRVGVGIHLRLNF